MGLQIKWVKEELTPEQKIKKLQRKLAFAILIILLMALGFVIYELKFAEKSIFDKGDKYEEYDPNYISNDNSNIEQAGKKETSNVIEGITSNINITSNAVNEKASNITSNNKSNNNSNSISNSNLNSNSIKDTEKPTVSKVDVTTTQTNITVSNVVCKDNKTETSKLKKEYSINGKSWQTSNKFNLLNPGTSYTIYVRVTDEAGNVSNTYSVKATTSHISIGKDVNGNYSNNVYVIQNGTNENTIYVKYNNKYYLGTLKSSNSYSKTYSLKQAGTTNIIDGVFIDNTIKIANNTYKKSNSINAAEGFEIFYGGTFLTTSQTNINGYYVSGNNYMYIIGYKEGSKNKYKIYAYSSRLKGSEWATANESTGTAKDTIYIPVSPNDSTILAVFYKFGTTINYVCNDSTNDCKQIKYIIGAASTGLKNQRDVSMYEALELICTH